MLDDEFKGRDVESEPEESEEYEEVPTAPIMVKKELMGAVRCVHKRAGLYFG